MHQQTMTEFIPCPVCKQEAKLTGKIPDSIFFAGRRMEKPTNGGGYYSCPNCSMNFRWPRMSVEESNLLYEQGDESHWAYMSQNRYDWRMVRQIILDLEKNQEGIQILDVGCWDGSFLEILPKTVHRFGVEIHPEAAARAEQKNVMVLANDLNELGQINKRFDLIVAFDVIEHIVNPLRFLRSLSSLLKKGGRVVIATGNSQAASWRFLGSRYYYCVLPEHVSFINPDWCKFAANQLDWQLENISYYSHVTNPNIRTRFLEIGKAISYRYAPFVVRSFRSIGLGSLDVVQYPNLLDHPFSWLTAKDHMLSIFKNQ